jgi:hypothetical protein
MPADIHSEICRPNQTRGASYSLSHFFSLHPLMLASNHAASINACIESCSRNVPQSRHVYSFFVHDFQVPGWRTDTSPQMSQTRAAGAEKRRSNHALDASPRQANTLPATPHSGAAAGDEDVASQTSTQGAGSDSDAKLPLLAALAVANEVGRANTQMPATKREQAGQLSNRCARQQAIQPLFARGPLHLEDVARTVIFPPNHQPKP